MNVQNRANLSADELAAVTSELGNLQTLADVLRWGQAQAKDCVSRTIISNVVVQDEFTHDVVVPRRNGWAIVFGST